MNDKRVIKNEFGFYSVVDKPSKTELEHYYSQKYYQEEKGNYALSYGDEELNYFYNKIEQKYSILDSLIMKNEKRSMLDFGCGEGFALDFFQKKGWDVLGLDYSDFGCKRFNPHLTDQLLLGDIYEKANELIKDGVVFDVVWIKHVLEHVIDPLEALVMCRKLTAQNGILVVEVPNDFSVVQEYLINNGKIERPFWIAIPDHLSYFNRQGLINICSHAGWETVVTLGDFPIDFSLFNPSTNYAVNKDNGAAVHRTRIEIENLLHSISIEKTNAYYEAMANLGIGRQIIGLFKKSAL